MEYISVPVVLVLLCFSLQMPNKVSSNADQNFTNIVLCLIKMQNSSKSVPIKYIKSQIKKDLLYNVHLWNGTVR